MQSDQRTSVVYFGEFDAKAEAILPRLPARFARLRTDDPAAVAEMVARRLPLVLVLDADFSARALPALAAKLKGKTAEAKLVVLYSSSKEAGLRKILGHRALCDVIRKPLDPLRFEMAVRKAADLLDAEHQCGQLSYDLSRQRDDLEKFFQVGIALSTQHNLETLLDQIVKECRRATRADAGSLYLMEESDGQGNGALGAPYRRDVDHAKVLRFTVAQNHSVTFPFKSFTMPVSTTSIAGYVASKGEILNLRDVYDLPKGSPFGFNRGFDQQVGYRSCSMLVVPMRNREEEVIGVLQLINKKRPGVEILDRPERTPHQVEAFDVHDGRLLLSLASQAAVSIEKVRLYEDIARLFEALAQSYAHALEIRDPVTGGHSNRLVHYAVTMAQKINEQSEGPFAKVQFTEDEMLELKYASYLHDVGKIGVREAVLTKAHKLSPPDEEALRARFGFIEQALIAEAFRAGKAEPGKPLAPEIVGEVEGLQADLKFLLDVNARGYIKPEELKRVQEIGARQYTDVDRQKKNLLTPHEIDNLTILAGNLTKQERSNIETHIALTWDILQQIPWPKRFRNVPHIAGSHHEKLDGTGYPHQLKSENLLIQARLLGILDIFEALTARDRPYKPPMPIEKAVAILREDAEKGKLDKDLVNLFIEIEAWKHFKQTFDSLATKAAQAR